MGRERVETEIRGGAGQADIRQSILAKSVAPEIAPDAFAIIGHANQLVRAEGRR